MSVLVANQKPHDFKLLKNHQQSFEKTRHNFNEYFYYILHYITKIFITA